MEVVQARENDLSYEEFIGLLLQDEKQVRAAKSLSHKIQLAKFEEAKTIESKDILQK